MSEIRRQENRPLSWWIEGSQFAISDPLGFAVMSAPLLIFVMPLHCLPLIWLLFWTLVAVIRGCSLFHPAGIRSQSVPLMAMIFLGWMWSTFFSEMPANWQVSSFAVINGMGLIVFILGVWRVARDPLRLEWMLRGLTSIGVLTVLISIPVHYLMQGHSLVYSRLVNVVPYCFHGLHPVNSGMLWAFSAVGVAAGYTQTESTRHRVFLAIALSMLVAAIFLTQTRGALLGLAFAFITLMLTRRPARWLPILAVTILTALFCQQLPNLVPSAIAGKGDVDRKLPISATGQMISRGDSGRLKIYKILWQRMNGPREFLMGRGFWSKDTPYPNELHWKAPHPHGAFISTGFHGGVIGLFLLSLLVGIGGRRIIRLATQKIDVRWLALFAAGSASLVFDGQTFVWFQTIPLFESLLFWFPLIAGASRGVSVMDPLADEVVTEELFPEWDPLPMRDQTRTNSC